MTALARQLIIFSRYPEPGTTKTRLIPLLGTAGAAALQRRLTESLVHQARHLSQGLPLEFSIHHAGGTHEEMTAWLGPLHYVPQTEGDIGLRMEAAFRYSFNRGAGEAVLVGSDIPALECRLLQRAFDLLAEGRPVFGPSLDGGYYLIGLQERHLSDLRSALFHHIPWSTARVMEETGKRLRKTGVGFSLLERLGDIDTPEAYLAAKRQGLL